MATVLQSSLIQVMVDAVSKACKGIARRLRDISPYTAFLSSVARPITVLQPAAPAQTGAQQELGAET